MRNTILIVFATIFLSGAMNAQTASKQDSVQIAAEIEKFEASVKASKPAKADTVININTATVEDLQKLPRIGEVTAIRIITYRDSLPGKKFAFKGQMLGVKGIGKKTFTKIFHLITI
jgi:competence ComEA-like helix-hairpin-helix protein